MYGLDAVGNRSDLGGDGEMKRIKERLVVYSVSLLGILSMAIPIMGYLGNLCRLWYGFEAAGTRELVFRILGIFAVPLGVILGFIPHI